MANGRSTVVIAYKMSMTEFPVNPGHHVLKTRNVFQVLPENLGLSPYLFPDRI